MAKKKEIFQNESTKEIIKYIKKQYNDEPEFLWAKNPKNAIFREKESTKWYAAILVVEKRKLGINEKGTIEILDLKNEPEIIETIIDNESYLPGYHMNKQHWFTILLDGTLKIEEIFDWIDLSYDLVKK